MEPPFTSSDEPSRQISTSSAATSDLSSRPTITSWRRDLLRIGSNIIADGTNVSLEDIKIWKFDERDALLSMADPSVSTSDSTSRQLPTSQDLVDLTPSSTAPTFPSRTTAGESIFTITNDNLPSPRTRSPHTPVRNIFHFNAHPIQAPLLEQRDMNPSKSSSNPRIDREWLSTLHIAAQKGHDRIVRILMNQNADCDEKDSEGITPLMYAVIGNSEAVVNVLLDHDVSIVQVDQQRRSAVHWAVLHQRESILRALLRHHSERGSTLDIDAYDDAGWTALHMAVYQGFESGVVMLLECGANPHFKARKCPFTGNIIP